MGGTLPAMARALHALAPGPLGSLYAVNTIGAACGPVLAAFVLIPATGLSRTVYAAAALNAAVAAGAFLLARRMPCDAPAEPPAAPEDPPPAANPHLPLLLAGASGFVAMAMEVVLVRRLVLTVTGSSVYALATILSLFLAGIALGSWIVRLRPPRGGPDALRQFAYAMAAVFAYAMLSPFWESVPLTLAPFWARMDLFELRAALNAAVVAVMLVPVTAFGYALPLLSALSPARGPAAVGTLFAANTAGAALGAPVAGFLLLPALGLDRALVALGGAALAAGAAAFLGTVPARRRPLLLAATMGILAATALVPEPNRSVMSAGLYNRARTFVVSGGSTLREAVNGIGPIVWQRDGVSGRIALRRAYPNGLSFVVNGKPDGSTEVQDLLTEIGSVHLAALCHPRPRTALLIGLGTGISAGALLAHPGIAEVHVAEIDPAVAEVARVFAPWNRDAMADPRLRLHLDDARHFLLTDTRQYDLIVAEPTNLWVSGIVNLYTVEALELVRRRLAPGGVVLQWLHYYQVGEADLLGALATFQSVFPHATFWMHDSGDGFMAASDAPLALDAAEWERRMREPEPASDLARSGLANPFSLMAFYRLGPADLGAAVRDARICRDDDPYLEFTTPRVPWNPVTTSGLYAFLRSLAVSSPVPLVRESAPARVRLGRAFMECGDLTRARLEFDRALALDTGSAGARRGLRDVAAFYRDNPSRR